MVPAAHAYLAAPGRSGILALRGVSAFSLAHCARKRLVIGIRILGLEFVCRVWATPIFETYF